MSVRCEHVPKSPDGAVMEHWVVRGGRLKKPRRYINQENAEAFVREYEAKEAARPKQERRTVSFGGVRFSGLVWWEWDSATRSRRPNFNRVTVPRNVLARILSDKPLGMRADDRLVCFCNYDYSDDYAYDAETNYGRGEVSPSRIYTKSHGAPHLCYLEVDESGNGTELHLCPYQNLSYTIRERPGWLHKRGNHDDEQNAHTA